MTTRKDRAHYTFIHHPSIHQSVVFRLSGVGSLGQQFKQGIPDIWRHTSYLAVHRPSVCCWWQADEANRTTSSAKKKMQFWGSQIRHSSESPHPRPIYGSIYSNLFWVPKCMAIHLMVVESILIYNFTAHLRMALKEKADIQLKVK